MAGNIAVRHVANLVEILRMPAADVTEPPSDAKHRGWLAVIVVIGASRISRPSDLPYCMLACCLTCRFRIAVFMPAVSVLHVRRFV